MGLSSGGRIIRRIFGSEILGAHFWEGAFYRNCTVYIKLPPPCVREFSAVFVSLALDHDDQLLSYVDWLIYPGPDRNLFELIHVFTRNRSGTGPGNGSKRIQYSDLQISKSSFGSVRIRYGPVPERSRVYRRPHFRTGSVWKQSIVEN